MLRFIIYNLWCDIWLKPVRHLISSHHNICQMHPSHNKGFHFSSLSDWKSVAPLKTPPDSVGRSIVYDLGLIQSVFRECGQQGMPKNAATHKGEVGPKSSSYSSGQSNKQTSQTPPQSEMSSQIQLNLWTKLWFSPNCVLYGLFCVPSLQFMLQKSDGKTFQRQREGGGQAT